MANEMKIQAKLREQLGAIKHPNISFEIYPVGKRLGDFDRVPIIYPLSSSQFVLLELNISNGISIFSENTTYQFISNHLFISSSMGLVHWFRSDGALDATGSSCKLYYEKLGLKSFELITDNETNKQHLVLNLNDKNVFRSVGFKTLEKVPDNFTNLLNEALAIKKWL